MKKIVYINLSNTGSTGKIMRSLADLAEQNGYKTYMAYPDAKNEYSKNDDIIIGNKFFRKIERRICMLKGKHDCEFKSATLKFLKKLDKIQPDIIHLHNIHNGFLNIELLFNYIKSHDVKVIWTLHDCWAFTAQCPHFTAVGCNKWKTGCYDCPQYKEYFRTYIDRTKYMWQLKKQLFTDVKNLTIVTPSKWLKDLVKQSFLKEYPVKVINNGIDLSVFKPTKSDLLKEYGLENKKILLSVASYWNEKKGIDVIKKLANDLGGDYAFVLVGKTNDVSGELPSNVVCIKNTSNQIELAKIYSTADVFIFPSKEENYPTVLMESLACGTPVITFNVGGSGEIVDDSCGQVIDGMDFKAMLNEIKRVVKERPYTKKDCLKKAKDFDEKVKFSEYINLYDEVK